MRVLVPFGRRCLTGYVVGFPQKSQGHKIKEIYDLLDDEPLFNEEDLKFYRWISDYYYHPFGETIKTALPSGINAEFKNVVSITEKGKVFLSEAPKDFPGTTILRELSKSKEASFKYLEKSAGRKKLNYYIRTLCEQGLIECSVKQKGNVRIKKEKWFSAFGNLGDISLRSKKQHEIFSFILEKGVVSEGFLKEGFGNCSSQLKSLVEKGFLKVEEREIFRRPKINDKSIVEPINRLTSDQSAVLRRLEPAIKQKKYFPMLLHGVTGSGKTEVYLKVMEKVLKAGRQCLYLVPEIALTSQLWDRISSRLNVPIAMLHSSLTDAERFDAWRMIAKGDIKIVLGARSAVFASFLNLGAVIVDEEHDPSYKQDEKLRYNARDLSLLKGKLADAVVILGSATPSIESYHNALKKKYTLGKLPKRVEDRKLPEVRIIDMRIEKALEKKGFGILSKALKDALTKRLEAGEQSLLFLNRRGFSSAYICQECGHVFKCPNCDVSLIHHMNRKKLCCHYCDFSLPVPDECPECKSYFLVPTGWGTERLEKEIRRIFPGVRTARMDRDTTEKKGASGKIIREVYDGKIDVLLGTQMIVKGYHLPNITLVGVVSADQSLNFPDYHAGERTFQLLTQVAGRAGRGEVEGEVLIQTYNPDHYSLACAKQHDFERFYKTEIEFRKEPGYPPYKKIINLRFDSTSRISVEACAKEAGVFARQLLSNSDDFKTVEILGPARALWEKIKGRYRYQMLIKGSNLKCQRLFVSKLMAHCSGNAKTKGARLSVDVDPLFIA
jgi:primosomal protein N' (replication factor Y)